GPVPESVHPPGSSGTPFAVLTSLAPPRQPRNREHATTHSGAPHAAHPAHHIPGPLTGNYEPARTTQGAPMAILTTRTTTNANTPSGTSMWLHGLRTPRDTRTRSTAQPPHQHVATRSPKPPRGFLGCVRGIRARSRPRRRRRNPATGSATVGHRAPSHRRVPPSPGTRARPAWRAPLPSDASRSNRSSGRSTPE